VSELRWEERGLNNNELLERKAHLWDATVEEVIDGLRKMSVGIAEPKVTVEYESDPHGGFGDEYIIVTGKLIDKKIKARLDDADKARNEQWSHREIARAKELLRKEGYQL
jgi:hypothetical protein